MSNVLLVLVLVLAGCAKDRLPSDPWAEQGGSSSGGSSDGSSDGSSGSAAGGGEQASAGGEGSSGSGPGRSWPWTVHTPQDATAGERLAAQDMAILLGQVSGETVEIEPESVAQCVPGSLHVGITAPAPAADAPDDGWSFAESRCDDGVLVELSGPTPLSRQHAAYAWLQRLGVRFFHPEQIYVPNQLDWGDEPRSVTTRPAFRWRGVRPDLSRPIELAAGSDTERRAYARWQVANGGNLAAFAQGVERGMARSTSFHLHRSTSTQPAVVAPEDGRSEEEQIDRALQEALSKGPQIVHFTFDGPGNSEVSDVDAVRRMTYVTDRLRDEHPGVMALTSNRGVAGAPTPEYGVRFFDLARFAPPELGVKVRPLMFFDLFRKAPVYGKQDNAALFAFMADQAESRRIWHAPEAAHGGTFDLSVPLYLPITLDARSRDIQGIAALLEVGLDGHELLGSGQEWGYWQSEWCSLRLAVTPALGLEGCLDELSLPMGEAADVVKAVLQDAIALQARELVDGDLLRWFVGTTPEVELAAAVGVQFHPLPPAPASVRGWPEADLRGWLDLTAPALDSSATRYAQLVLQLHEVEEQVPEAGRPWFDEIRDGLTIMGLRASHAGQAYGALVRSALGARAADEELSMRAGDDLVAARRVTELAQAVIARREAAYRYGSERPLGDDEAMGYLAATHQASYWTRLDELVAEELAGGAEPVRASDSLLAIGQELVLWVPDPTLGSPAVDFGDGASAEGREHVHAYAAAGVYPLVVTGQRRSGPWEFSTHVAVVTEETASGAPRVVEPAGAALITPLLPGLVVGLLPAGRVAVGFDGDDDGRVTLGDWRALTWAVDAQGAPTDSSVAQALALPMADSATGRTLATLSVEGAVFQRPTADNADVASLSGSLPVQGLIDLVIGVGAFDEAGAREAVADVLGFAADALPEATPLRIEWDFAPPG